MTRRRGWRLGVALAVATAVAVVVPAASQARQTGDPRAVLDAYLAHAGPGAALYAGAGAQAWTVTSGTASTTQHRPITPTEHFWAASQTKTFTAAVVLQLVDEGLVDLDAPVERYLPGVVAGNGHDGNAISVRQLLQHTSGISADYAGAQPRPDGTYAKEELVRAGLSHPPGTGYAYSNINYVLAGMLIERITGEPAGQVIAQRISEPLGLTGTAYPADGDRTLDAPFLPGYRGERVGPFFYWIDTTTSREPSFVSTAGAMTSTLTDLVAFERALAAGDVVSPGSLAEMRETVPVPQTKEFDYGLGLMHQTLSCGGEAWGHAGDLPSGHSSVTMVTDDGRFAALVTNTIVTSTAAPTRYQVIDAALCDGR